MKKVKMTEASEPVQTTIADVIEMDGEGESIFEIDREDLRRSIKKGRSYIWPPHSADPKAYTSVTTVLNALPKPALTYWSAKVTAETAVEKIDILQGLVEDDPEAAVKWLKGAPWASRDKAADIGTTLHLIAELDALGHTEEADKIYKGLKGGAKRKADQMRDFFDKVPVEILVVEGVVYNDSPNYAGAFDFIVKVTDPELLGRLPVYEDGDELTLLVDLKTGKGVYPEVALQLAAYRHADKMVDLRAGTLGPMVPTDGGAVLHVTEDHWSFIPVECGDDVYATFVKIARVSDDLPLDTNMIGSPSVKGKVAHPKTKAKTKAKGRKPRKVGDFRNMQ